MQPEKVPLPKLFLRIFPTVEIDTDNIGISKKENAISIKRSKYPGVFIKNNNLFYKYRADCIIQNISQEKIFKTTVDKKILHKLYKGVDLVVITFGCYGTGKTYTMFGMKTESEYRGIVPRLLEDIFKYKSKNDRTKDIELSLQYVEIHGKDILDLLQKGKPKATDQVRPTSLLSLEEAYDLISYGYNQRTMALNSHCATAVLTIIVECSLRNKQKLNKQQSKVHLVEMAGIGQVRELIDAHHISGNIDKSFLSTLCSWADRTFNETIPSWRSSQLACYLGKSLSNGCLRFIGHLRVTRDAISSTLSTLDFAYRLMRFPPCRSIVAPPGSVEAVIHIRQLKKELNEIKEAKIISEITNGVRLPELASEDEHKNATKLVKLYLKGDLTEKKLLEECHTMLFLAAFKAVYKTTWSGIQEKICLMTNEIIDCQKLSKKKKFDTDSIDSRVSVSARMTKRKIKKLEDNKSQSFLAPERSQNDTSIFGNTKEQVEIGHSNYYIFLCEFLNKNPQLSLKVNAYKEDIAENSRVLSAITNEVIKTKKELENVTKDRQLSGVNQYGNVISSFEEHLMLINKEETLQQKLHQFQQRLIVANKDYLHNQQALIDYRWDVETQFNVYVRDLYSNFIIISPLQHQPELYK